MNSVRKGLEGVPGLRDIQVQLARPQVQFSAERPVPLDELQTAIGHYSISPVEIKAAPKSYVAEPASPDTNSILTGA